eukprot:CAMPEP_0117688520 /NCGR_PEP_ID=MMETSP0804-20121206/23889_1 /TAXON_ID=1074897 /ORGANISM="Tetraselmis astigmatica, Strain CCMP880" /LENGTH=92 /DNA_ID=CAMNT_0005501009 /DNA_START=248 /DNA_END=524 /DNA_ORIENTATION=-
MERLQEKEFCRRSHSLERKQWVHVANGQWSKGHVLSMGCTQPLLAQQQLREGEVLWQGHWEWGEAEGAAAQGVGGFTAAARMAAAREAEAHW